MNVKMVEWVNKRMNAWGKEMNWNNEMNQMNEGMNWVMSEWINR